MTVTEERMNRDDKTSLSGISRHISQILSWLSRLPHLFKCKKSPLLPAQPLYTPLSRLKWETNSSPWKWRPSSTAQHARSVKVKSDIQWNVKQTPKSICCVTILVILEIWHYEINKSYNDYGVFILHSNGLWYFLLIFSLLMVNLAKLAVK